MADIKKSSIGGKSTCHLLNIKQPARVGKRLKLNFRRTKVTVNVLKTGRSIHASMGLIDISEKSAGLFTNELLLKGSAVEICITEPRLLKVKGLVAWSVPVQTGVHEGKLKFRSGLQFSFENEVQKAAINDFIQSINMDPLEIMRATTTQGEPLPATGLAPAGTAPAAPAADPAAAATAPAGDPATTPTSASEAAPAPTADANAAPTATPALAEAPKAEEVPAATAAETPKAA